MKEWALPFHSLLKTGHGSLHLQNVHQESSLWRRIEQLHWQSSSPRRCKISLKNKQNITSDILIRMLIFIIHVPNERVNKLAQNSRAQVSFDPLEFIQFSIRLETFFPISEVGFLVTSNVSGECNPRTNDFLSSPLTNDLTRSSSHNCQKNLEQKL